MRPSPLYLNLVLAIVFSILVVGALKAERGNPVADSSRLMTTNPIPIAGNAIIPVSTQAGIEAYLQEIFSDGNTSYLVEDQLHANQQFIIPSPASGGLERARERSKTNEFSSLAGLNFANVLPSNLTAAPAGPLIQPFGYQALETDNMAQELMALEEQSERLLKARKAIRTAQGIGNFLRKLDSLAFQEFPVVLADTIGTVPVAIVFDKLQIHPEYAQLEVVLGMKLPQRTVSATQGQPKVDDEGTPIEYVELFFGTPNLKFSHNGGIIGDITLGLYSNVPIGSQDPNKFGFVLKGWRSAVIPGSGGQTQDVGTYVKIDCDGFKEMGVEADVMFSREWIIPTNDNGLLHSSGRVRGSISTTVNDWNNIIVELNLPDFALASYPEFAFNLSNAVFDFSDYRNSSLVQFPPGYAEAYLPPSNHNLWRGVYIQNLELLLPPQLAKASEQGGGGGTTTGGSTGMLMLDDYGEHSYTSVGLDIPDFAVEYGMRDATGQPRTGPQVSDDPLALSTDLAPAAAPIDSTIIRTRIGVNGLLVDGHGVSGHFYATNVINMGEGKMNDKWRFSVTSLEATLVASEVTGFGFGGNVTLPVAKEGQSFGYDAFVNIPDREYNFTVTIQQDYTFPLFKMADVTIEAGSFLDIVSTPTTFVPSAVLYGNAQINAATAAGGPSNAGDAVFSGAITFAGLKLSTASPRMSFETGGSLGLSDVTLMGYTLPLADPRLIFTEAGPRLSVGIALNLMNQSDNGFSAGTDVSVLSSLDSTKTYDIYVNKGMKINSIYVRLKLPSINAFGYVHLFDDDPVFGNGFQGSLSVRIGPDTLSPIFAIEMNAIFGNVSYPYWYVDGMVESNAINVPIIPGVLSINGVGGGAYYHMKMDGYDGINGTDGSAGTTTSGVRYVPNQSITLGLKLSVPLTNWKPPGGGAASGPETLDGVATLELAFAGAALQDIMFYGKVEIVSPAVDKFAGGFANKWKDRLVKLPQDRPTVEAGDKAATNNPSNSILGSLFLRMNFEYGFEFQGTARVKLNAANGKIVGTGGIDILISAPQSKWHLYVGGYTDNSIMASDNEVLEPISVTINLGEGITAGAGAYFLMGNDIPGPPPLHPAAAAYFGISSSTSHNRGSLGDRAAQGTGFAFGAYVFAYIEKRTRNKGKYKNNRMKAELGAGFDVSLLKYERMTRCSKDTNQTPHGHKGWRATGRIWAYIDADIKYRGIGKNLGVGVLIQADIPNPTYLYMIIKVKVVFNFTVKFGIGDECGSPMNI